MNGGYARALDFTQPPADGGPGQIAPGSTWNFQLWYRDPSGGPSAPGTPPPSAFTPGPTAG